jgi:hypothetical protein
MAYSNFENNGIGEINEQNHRDERADNRADVREAQDARKLKYDWIENEWVETRLYEDQGFSEGRVHDTIGTGNDGHTRRRRNRNRKTRYTQTDNVFDIPTEKVPENDDPNDWKRTKLEVDNRYTVMDPQVFVSLLSILLNFV